MRSQHSESCRIKDGATITPCYFGVRCLCATDCYEGLISRHNNLFSAYIWSSTCKHIEEIVWWVLVIETKKIQLKIYKRRDVTFNYWPVNSWGNRNENQFWVIIWYRINGSLYGPKISSAVFFNSNENSSGEIFGNCSSGAAGSRDWSKNNCCCNKQNANILTIILHCNRTHIR